MKPLLLTALLLHSNSPFFAQSVLRNTAELKLSLPFSQESGTNGAAVAFNPAQNVYYAVMAGNEEYPLEKFDLQGNPVFSAKSGIDVRGMWWNPKTKSLEANAYGDSGYYKIDLEENGNPGGFAIKLISGQNQPSEECAAAFDPVKQILFFYLKGAVYTYSRKNGKAARKCLFLDIPVEIEKINYTSMIYTGVKGIEFGLLNYVDGEVLFFDKKNGKNTGAVKLGLNPPLNDVLRFSFANNLVWLYNAEYRIWYGYEIYN